MSFVSELRRRQVFRTAAWYGGFAWLAIEVANTVFPNFGLPQWAVRTVIVAGVLGLPLALVLAWSFDLSGAGLRREDAPLRPAVPAVATPVWHIPSFWIAVALGVGLTVSAQQAWQRLIRPATGDRAAIAVLPFANLSPDPENAYFADGLHEEVLATLARAGSLRVISRTSVEQYRNSRASVPDIADALGVDLILEGSVRRAGDDLRLTLQLIDGESDEHLWAETYDRKFRDALQLQKTVASQVVAAIGAALSPAEAQLIERTLPTVPEAYDAYIHALALWQNPESEADMRVLGDLLDQTIGFDPQFAPAYALRAKHRVMRTAAHPEAADLPKGALADIERALELEPELPEALVARGLYYTYVTLDPERALVDLTRALSLAPSDADTQWATAMTLRRLGRFDEAIERFRDAARLAPGLIFFATGAAETLTRLGRNEEAERERLALVERYPADPFLRLLRYYIRFQATGETAGWREEHERLAPTIADEAFRAVLEQAMLTATGDLEGLVALRERVTVEIMADSRDLELATIYLVLGDAARARPHLDALVSSMTSQPEDYGILAEGAVALELLGRTSEALQVADRAVGLRPERLDALNGKWIAMLPAWVLIHSRIGAEEGYRELERLLGGIDLHPRWFAVRPLWMLLRDDARTQEIIRSRIQKG